MRPLLAIILFPNHTTDPCSSGNATGQQVAGLNCGTTLASHVKNITNAVVFVAGLIAVIIIIIAGFRYVISQGDEKAVGDAKNMMLYAIIGLVIVLLSYAAVNFVIQRLT